MDDMGVWKGETNGSHQPVDGESRQSSRCRLLQKWVYTLEVKRLEPTAITHLERKMIWTKPPGNYVPAVNLQGCSRFFARGGKKIDSYFVIRILRAIPRIISTPKKS